MKGNPNLIFTIHCAPLFRHPTVLPSPGGGLTWCTSTAPWQSSGRRKIHSHCIAPFFAGRQPLPTGVQLSLLWDIIVFSRSCAFRSWNVLFFCVKHPEVDHVYKNFLRRSSSPYFHWKPQETSVSTSTSPLQLVLGSLATKLILFWCEGDFNPQDGAWLWPEQNVVSICFNLQNKSSKDQCLLIFFQLTSCFLRPWCPKCAAQSKGTMSCWIFGASQWIGICRSWVRISSKLLNELNEFHGWGVGFYGALGVVDLVDFGHFFVSPGSLAERVRHPSRSWWQMAGCCDHCCLANGHEPKKNPFLRTVPWDVGRGNWKNWQLMNNWQMPGQQWTSASGEGAGVGEDLKKDVQKQKCKTVRLQNVPWKTERLIKIGSFSRIFWLRLQVQHNLRQHTELADEVLQSCGLSAQLWQLSKKTA